MSVKLDFSVPLERWPLFIHGAWLTIELALVATVLGFTLGTLCAVGRRGRSPWIARCCSFYVEVIRNTPFLVQIFLVYFGLSSLGLSLSAFVCLPNSLCTVKNYVWNVPITFTPGGPATVKLTTQ